MSTRPAIFLMLLALSSQILAAEFPTGSLKGKGFIVEKDTMKITDKDLYAYTSSARIVKRSDDTYEFTITAYLQKAPATPRKTEKRVDVFNVIWESSDGGRLVNRNSKYKNDRTTFTIRDNELVVKSWIARNQLWETHIYSLAK